MKTWNSVFFVAFSMKFLKNFKFYFFHTWNYNYWPTMFSLFLITVHLKSRIPKNLVFGRCHILFIRSILEYCAVVWHSSLTCEQSADIERVQKVATRTILQDFNVPYETALGELHLEKLDERRKQLCLNFAKQCTKSEKNMHMFPLKGSCGKNTSWA